MASESSIQAVAKWGVDGQCHKAVEEFGELITALMRFYNGRGTNDDVVTEIADCYIMLDQLSHIFDESDVDKELVAKESRLLERLAND